jgi:hypothetical protein
MHGIGTAGANQNALLIEACKHSWHGTARQKQHVPAPIARCCWACNGIICTVVAVVLHSCSSL